MNYLRTKQKNSKNVYKSTLKEDLFILGIITACIIVPEIIEFIAKLIFKI